MKTAFKSDLKTVTFSGVTNLRKPNLSGSYVQYNEKSMFPKPNEIRHISSITAKRRDYLDITQRSTAFKNGKLTTSFISFYKSSKRFYSTEIPESVKNLIAKAPSGGFYQEVEQIQEYLKPQGRQGDYDKRQFTYFVISTGRFLYAAGIRLLILKFLYTWTVAADLKALATIEVDVSNVPAGKTILVTWRGKPVFVRHRTAQEIEIARTTPLDVLRDPQRDEDRFQDPNWAVLIAICTHLGCVPISDAGDWHAFFCPCHGSHYDISGRVRKGPAPLNLHIPPHKIEGTTLTLG